MLEETSRLQSLERQVTNLKEEVGNLREKLDCSHVSLNTLKVELSQRDQQFKRKCDELVQMQNLVSN